MSPPSKFRISCMFLHTSQSSAFYTILVRSAVTFYSSSISIVVQHPDKFHLHFFLPSQHLVALPTTHQPGKFPLEALTMMKSASEFYQGGIMLIEKNNMVKLLHKSDFSCIYYFVILVSSTGNFFG